MTTVESQEQEFIDETETESEAAHDLDKVWGNLQPLERPKALPNITQRFNMPCGVKIYVTVTFTDTGEPFEVFVNPDTPDESLFTIKDNADATGKLTYCHKSVIEGLGRVISLYLRTGGDHKRVGKSLMGVKCAMVVPGSNTPNSCTDAIGQMLYNFKDKLNSEDINNK